MSKTLLVPWQSTNEWYQVQVLQWIREHNIDSLKKSQARMRAWQVRGRPPLAIETTLALINAMLYFQEHPTNTAAGQHQASSILGLAIIRFVNGFSDSKQNAQCARSVGSVAAELSIPTYLVDLRHMATHQAMPSPHMLYTAADEALLWLKQNYWEKQVEADSTQQQQVSSMLMSYCAIAEKVDISSSQLKEHTTGKRMSAFAALTTRIVKESMAHLKEVISDLLEFTSHRNASKFAEKMFYIWKPLLDEICAQNQVGAGLFARCLLHLDVTCEFMENWLSHISLMQHRIHLEQIQKILLRRAQSLHFLDGFEPSDVENKSHLPPIKSDACYRLHWHPCKEDVWGETPLGLLPGNVIPFLQCTIDNSAISTSVTS
eukprot:gene10465-2595_t